MITTEDRLFTSVYLDDYYSATVHTAGVEYENEEGAEREANESSAHQPKNIAPTNNLIVLTEQMIRAGCSAKYGWTLEQLHILQQSMPLPSDWVSKKAGTLITKHSYELFLMARLK